MSFLDSPFPMYFQPYCHRSSSSQLWTFSCLSHLNRLSSMHLRCCCFTQLIFLIFSLYRYLFSLILTILWGLSPVLSFFSHSHQGKFQFHIQYIHTKENYYFTSLIWVRTSSLCRLLGHSTTSHSSELSEHHQLFLLPFLTALFPPSLLIMTLKYLNFKIPFFYPYNLS